MRHQLPLEFEFNNELTFDSFHAGNNREAMVAVQQLCAGSGESCVYIWGGSGTGKSHLIQAACQSMSAQRMTVAMIPMKCYSQFSPDMLQGLERLPLICVDDVESVAGQATWEEALFHLFNRVRETGNRLLISGQVPPAQQTLRLADLKSRLGWCLVYQLPTLNDDQKLLVLQQRADGRGMDLNDEVGRFLLTRYSRDLASLLRLLDRLDAASLSEQRRLTIPFVRQHLEI